MIYNSLTGGRRGSLNGNCSLVNLRCFKIENCSWFIGRVGISYGQLRWHETFRSWLGTWKYQSSKFTTLNNLKTNILDTSKLNHSALSQSISSLAKYVSFLCSFSSFFAYPTKVFPSGSVSPYLLLLTTSRFVELSFASFVPLPTPPFSHSPVFVANCVSRVGSSSVLLSCSSVILSCFIGFLSCSSVFLSQDSSSPSSVHVFTTWPFCCWPWHVRLRNQSLLFPRNLSLFYLPPCLGLLPWSHHIS